MSMPDDAPAPSPGAAAGGASGPPAAPRGGSGPGNFPPGGVGPGQGLAAPVPTSRDRDDALAPEKLNATELTAQQSIDHFNLLLRLAAVPGTEPSYGRLVASLVKYEGIYRDLNATAETAYHREVRVRDLIAALDMTKLENIQAYADAAREADAALMTWDRVYKTYREIHDCLHKPDVKVAANAPTPRRIGDLPA